MSLAHFLTLFHVSDICPLTESAVAKITNAQGLLKNPEQFPDQTCPADSCLSVLILLLDHYNFVICPHSDDSNNSDDSDDSKGVQLIDRNCLNDVVFRAWLFALMTSVETSMKKDMLSDAYWREALSPDRMQKARDLKAERARRGQEVDTMSCLQFGDIGHAAFKKSSWMDMFSFSSRKRAKKQMRGLESLRNNLAHAQDVVSMNWDTIVLLAMNIDHVRDLDV